MNNILKSIQFNTVHNKYDTTCNEYIKLPISKNANRDYERLYNQVDADNTYVGEDEGLRILDFKLFTDYNPSDHFYRHYGNVTVTLTYFENIQLDIDKSILDLVTLEHGDKTETRLSEIYTLNKMGTNNKEWIDDVTMEYKNITLKFHDHIDDFDEYLELMIAYNQDRK